MKLVYGATRNVPRSYTSCTLYLQIGIPTYRKYMYHILQGIRCIFDDEKCQKSGATYIPYVVSAVVTLFMSHRNIINCQACSLDDRKTTLFEMSVKQRSYK